MQKDLQTLGNHHFWFLF